MIIRKSFLAVVFHVISVIWAADVGASQTSTRFVEQWLESLPEEVTVYYGSIEGDQYGQAAIIEKFSYSSPKAYVTAGRIELSGFENNKDESLVKAGKIFITDLRIQFDQSRNVAKIDSLSAQGIVADDIEELLNANFDRENIESLFVENLIIERFNLESISDENLNFDSLAIDNFGQSIIEELRIKNISGHSSFHQSTVSIDNVLIKNIPIKYFIQIFLFGAGALEVEGLPGLSEFFPKQQQNQHASFSVQGTNISEEDLTISIEEIFGNEHRDDPDWYKAKVGLRSLKFEGGWDAELEDYLPSEFENVEILELIKDVVNSEINIRLDTSHNKEYQVNNEIYLELKNLVRASLIIQGTNIDHLFGNLDAFESVDRDEVPAALSLFSFSLEDQKFVRVILDAVGQLMLVDRAGLAAQFAYLSRLMFAGQQIPDSVDQAIRSVQAFIDEPSKITISLAPNEPLAFSEFFESMEDPQFNIGELLDRLNVAITSN